MGSTSIESAEIKHALNALRGLVRALRLSSIESEKTVGIGSAQLFVLEELAAVPCASINELAHRTLTDQSSVSVVVARLAERGLVVRRTSRDDARRAEVSLTLQGRALLDRAPTTAQSRLVRALRKLPKRARRELTRTLELLVLETGPAAKVPAMFFEDLHVEAPRSIARRPKRISRRRIG
jgi:DNA-binding MarR family transcriptional regulator